MKYRNPWPPISPQDEKRYNIELKDGSSIENVEFWAFGGGFQPTDEKRGCRQLTDYPLDNVVSFELCDSDKCPCCDSPVLKCDPVCYKCGWAIVKRKG